MVVGSWAPQRKVGKVDWDEVADFVNDSYRLVAPRRLATLINVTQTGQDG